jgi:hypothetical protein
MRPTITPDHRSFFTKNNFIELEGLLPLDQIASLNINCPEAIAKRLKIPFWKLDEKTGIELFKAGYDLWRDSNPIKAILHKNNIATVASELFEVLPLRFGFDQYIATTKDASTPFSEPLPLQDTCCLSPLAGALILPLHDLLEPLPFFPMPQKAGHGLFISPSLPIPWPELFSTPDLQFIMIGFATGKTLFRPDTIDSHAVNLKQIGYVFNEYLKDSVHPILLRK